MPRLRCYRFEEAIEAVREFLPLGGDLDDALIRMHAPAVLGWAHKALGHPRAALEHTRKALEPARVVGTPYFVASSCLQIGRFQADLGDFEAARRTSEEGLAASPAYVMLLALRCFLEYTLGDFEAGDGFRRRILALSRRLAPGPYHVHIHAIATDVVRSYHLGDTLALGRHLPALQSDRRRSCGPPVHRLAGPPAAGVDRGLEGRSGAGPPGVP